MIDDQLIAKEDDVSSPILIENISIADFIGIWDTTYDCDSLIDYWHLCDGLGMATERVSFGLDGDDNEYRRNTLGDSAESPYEAFSRKDKGTALLPWQYERQRHQGMPLDRNLMYQYLGNLNSLINACLGQYITQFEGLIGYQTSVDPPNIQRTLPTEGYHKWHCEDAGMGVGKRLLAYMLYLNDGFEGGETEWLYQSRREAPVSGRMVIWPAGWTHMHRGNPPLSGEKYIATGWVQAVRS